MATIKKFISCGIILGTMVGITTCSSYRHNTLVKSKFGATQLICPLADAPLPQTDLFVKLPTPERKLYVAEKKRAIMRFTPFETMNVRTKDPLLFASGNTIIMDLKNIEDNNFAFPLPGSKVISPYGEQRKRHSGVDLKTRSNDTIVSAFDGIVRMSAPYAAYGNVIVVRHYNGLETVYSHNSRNLVKSGDAIRAGQAIALTGRTGHATTEHLHFEVRIDGEPVNPALFYDFENGSLRRQCFICTKKGGKIEVAAVHHFPFQDHYLSTY